MEVNTAKYMFATFNTGLLWKSLLATTGAIVAYCFPIAAQSDAAIGCLALLVLDYVTGICASIRNRVPISSRRMRESILKPITYVALLLGVAVMSSQFEVGRRLEGAGMTATLMFIAATEGKSLVENLIKCGVKVPGKLKQLFVGESPEEGG